MRPARKALPEFLVKSTCHGNQIAALDTHNLLAAVIVATARSYFSLPAYLKAMLSVYNTLIRHRILLRETGKQDIADRYAGQMLGMLWAFIHPVLTMLVFLFLFAFVLRMRMPEGSEVIGGWGGYVMYLLAGLVPWISLQEIMSRSIAAITSSGNLVKQVIFPLEVLPAKMLFSAFLTQCVSLGIYFIFGIILYGPPHATVFFLPWLIAVQLVGSLGIALLFSAIAPFFRDIKDIVQLLCFLLMYSLPIFYTIQMVPEWVRSILMLNPLLHMVECWHDALYWGTITSPLSWIIFPVFSIFLFAAGARTFIALKGMFGNVL
ncbi:MAG: ABC transporter permease [Desulfovibrio sp.]|jgi:lipopolysaccharide transport system permease protein|nr:ABC transporter permease [Desulfovibrio sp.]